MRMEARLKVELSKYECYDDYECMVTALERHQKCLNWLAHRAWAVSGESCWALAFA